MHLGATSLGPPGDNNELQNQRGKREKQILLIKIYIADNKGDLNRTAAISCWAEIFVQENLRVGVKGKLNYYP